MVKETRQMGPPSGKEASHCLISLFSGAGGFDLGLEEAGLDLKVCLEIDRDCCNTTRRNRPGLAVMNTDIRETTTEQILKAAGLREDQVFCVSGGPPCQSFSSGGKRSSILDSRGSLFMEYLRVIREIR